MRYNFTFCLSAFCVFCLVHIGFGQNYTWMRGLNTGTTLGVYGTQGTFSVGNDPGSRHGSNTWTDAQGNLWMFGGEGIANTPNATWYSDLWRYNPATNQWAWIKGPNTPNNAGTYGTLGVPNMANNPGAREFAMSWTDASGNFWLYGGLANVSSDRFADLWRYTPSNNMWTWMAGPNTVNSNGVYGTQNIPAASNNPGARHLAATWVDGGNLWLFGGNGFGLNSLGRLNDLWRYNISTNQWTWVKGTSAPSPTGVYGTFSVSATANTPGGREAPGFWSPGSGKLILFGGTGVGSTAGSGYLNDMWEFDVVSGNWTWINGSNSTQQIGVYGTLGVASASTMPGARNSPACWVDQMGDYWLFGGDGFPSNNANNHLNDLFKFNRLSSQWTWIKGSNLSGQTGTYGVQGVAAVNNTPGSRYYNTWWSNTSTGFLWLFGGLGLSSTAAPSESMNDLWRFKVPCSPDSAKAVPLSFCSGKSATLTAYNQFPSSVNWYTAATGGTFVGFGSTIITPALSAQNTASVYNFYAEANSCTVAPRTLVSVTVQALPQISITGPSSVCPGQTATLSASGGTIYAWANGATTSTLITPASSVQFTQSVSAYGANGCPNNASIVIGIFSLPSVQAVALKSFICRYSLESGTLTASGASTYTWSNAIIGQSILVTPTISTNYTVTGTDLNGCTNTGTVTQFVAFCGSFEKIQPNEILFFVSPNPSSGAFVFSSTENGRLQIFNSLGQLVLETDIQNKDNPIQTSLPKGIYYYSVLFNRDKVTSGKLLIE